jgi:branched-chain amino acid transport system substrate-binding protein
MSKSKKIIGAIVVVIVIILAVTLTKEPAQDDQITIGMISILSGDYSVVGENVRNGAILAQEQYNEANPESPVTLVIEDDGFDSKKALSAYQKLTSVDKIDGLISVSTPSIGAIYDLVVETDMPIIQLGEQTTEPTDDNVFQVLPGTIASEKKLGETIKERGFKNPIIVYTQNDTMIRFKDAVVAGYGEGMTEFMLEASDTDYRTDVLKVADGEHDIVVVLTFPQQGAQFLKTYMTQEGSLPQLALDANAQSGYSDYARILGDTNLLNGSIISIIAQETSDVFKAAYKERFGTEPGIWADLGYDAFNLAIETHNADGQKWIKNVENADFSGITGDITFDEVGVRSPKILIGTIENGALPESK